MGKSKKGSAFERTVCKDLSMWFSKGERDDIFWRTAGSGARATVRMKQGKITADSAGDIGALHASGKLLTSITIWEIKRGYGRLVTVLSMIDKLEKQKEPVIIQWFKKLNKEVKIHNRKFGFVIFKRDRKKICICMKEKTFDYINKRNTIKYKWPPFGPTAKIYLHNMQLVIMKLEDFFEWCEPESIPRRIVRRSKPGNWNKFRAKHGKIKRRKR